jgi:hypothetical protein
VSPAGEALMTLPPSVPRFWIWAAPMVAAASASAGTTRANLGGAPDLGVGRQGADDERIASTLMPRSSSRPQMSRTRSGGSPISPVIWTMRSVPPASGRHGAPPHRPGGRSAAARRVGDSDGGSTAFGIGQRLRLRMSAREPDTDDEEDQLAGRQRQGDVAVLDRLGQALGMFGHA